MKEDAADTTPLPDSSASDTAKSEERTVERRRLLAVLAVVTGCSTHDDKAELPHSVSSGSPDGARHAVEAYVDALNSRSATGLIKLVGVKDESWSRQEAAQISSTDRPAS
ncbi:hypothetical protein OH768_38990 [Streptomyces sp. NBC_01622]|uniref:hypothetical protein n=1 Tax=Streptomyces sp. NBC_01622 TaxID=2975903 RepID=UPI003863FED2|nr:hypothetical protein OH768_38990 [Streptomyces sp. NBC_01622]